MLYIFLEFCICRSYPCYDSHAGVATICAKIRFSTLIKFDTPNVTKSPVAICVDWAVAWQRQTEGHSSSFVFSSKTTATWKSEVMSVGRLCVDPHLGDIQQTATTMTRTIARADNGFR